MIDIGERGEEESTKSQERKEFFSKIKSIFHNFLSAFFDEICKSRGHKF